MARCEALAPRRSRGRGSLVVLDAPAIPLRHRQRMGLLWQHFGQTEIAVTLDIGAEHIAPAELYLAPVFTSDLALSLWGNLQSANVFLALDCYEGLVAKRADSPYPVQLRSPGEEFSGWVKHRWQW